MIKTQWIKKTVENEEFTNELVTDALYYLYPNVNALSLDETSFEYKAAVKVTHTALKQLLEKFEDNNDLDEEGNTL